MKLLLVGLAFMAVAAGSKYLPPQQDSLAVLEEIETLEPSGVLAQDGYRYKAVKRYRHRRDVSELASGYLPPAEELIIPTPNNQYLAPIETVEPIEQLADDGYRYKTVKRLRHRNRRDVNELSSAKYLPPVEQKVGYSYVPPAPVVQAIAPAPAPAPVEIAAPVEVAAPVALEAPVDIAVPVQDSTVLAKDGYRYKTIRRIRYRNRRDVSELPSTEYLPPVEIPVAEPINQYIPPVEISQPIEQIAEDGYRYKTVKRLRHRNRRDVNEVVSGEYLPPVQAKTGYSYPAPTPVEAVASAPVVAPAPVEISAPIEAPAPVSIGESAELSNDGYRYKTVRRIRYRVRRDVNELPAEYLPPVQEVAIPELNNQYLAPVETVEPIEQLADDGYRYKTVKRLRHRNRRDVNELSSAKYLPPVQEKTGYSYPAPAAVEVAAPVAEIAEVNTPVEVAAPVEVVAPEQQSAVLANDGYRYKTVRRIRYRVRRDVNEIPSNDYLPPALVAPVQPGYSYPAPAVVEAAAPAMIETPVNVATPAEVEIAAPIEQSAALAEDGYRYKTVRRIRYRLRRDVSELPAEYLPPVQEIDVPEPNNQYLAPIESVEPVQQLADDGYRYKTVKRLRYRNRRDVNELPAASYLPPVAQKVESSYAYPAPQVAVSSPVQEEVAVSVPAPVETAIAAPVEAVEISSPVVPTVELGSDGYRYRTVKRIRYRHRRDVNEIVGGEYLPPNLESAIIEPSNEYLAPAVALEEPIEQIAVDGYRYKTIKKYKSKRH